MSVLWAIVALLSIYIGGQEGVSSSILNLPGLEAAGANLLSLTAPAKLLSVPQLPSLASKSLANVASDLKLGDTLESPLASKRTSSKTETKGQQCDASAWFFISQKHVNDYLNKTLPEAITSYVKCSHFDMTGIVKPVIEVLNNKALLSGQLVGGKGEALGQLLSNADKPGSMPGGSLPLVGTGISSLTGGGGLSSLTGGSGLSSLTGGIGGSGLSSLTGGSGLPLVGKTVSSLTGGSGLSSLTGGIGGSGLSSLTGGTGGSGLSSLTSNLPVVGGSSGLSLLEGLPLKGLPLPFDASKIVDVAKGESENLGDTGKLGSLINQGSQKSGDIMNKAKKNTKDLSGGLGLNLESENTRAHPSDIMIKNITTTQQGDIIGVDSEVEVSVEGPDNLEGTIEDAIGFQMSLKVVLEIAVKINAAQCTSFIIVKKKITVDKSSLKLIKRVTNTLDGLPVPVPVPMGSVEPILTKVVSMALSEGNCSIELNNPECKNASIDSTKQDLFKYNIQNTTFNNKGLTIAYCSVINEKTKSIPVPGCPIPPIKTDNKIAVALSSCITKSVLAAVAKQSSIKSKEGELKVKKMTFKVQQNEVELYIKSAVIVDHSKIATVYTICVFPHNSKIVNGYIKDKLYLKSSSNKIYPSDNEDARELSSQLCTKIEVVGNEYLNRLNIPEGPQSELLNNATVKVDNQNDLIAFK